MRRAFLVLGLALVAALAAGPEAFGRLALRLGAPGPAAMLLGDPAWRGVALYRQGRYGPADDAFAEAGTAATFNRANSLARGGRYELAVAYYDAVLFRDPADEAARANRLIVSRLVEVVTGEGGDTPGVSIFALVAGSVAPTMGGTSLGRPAPAGQPEPAPLRPRDMLQSLVASRQWLSTLPDDPGLYLRHRLAAEQQRRRELGTAVPTGDDPW